jgi:hypothetical protein
MLASGSIAGHEQQQREQERVIEGHCDMTATHQQRADHARNDRSKLPHEGRPRYDGYYSDRLLVEGRAAMQ